MALLPWNDDEEQDEITGVTPIKRVVSVQDGAWQPSASGADKPVNNPLEGNYLFSEEKAQFDQQQEQRRQAEAQAAAAAAAAAAQARAAAQAQAQQVENMPPSRRAANNPGIVEAGKNDDGWKKYYDKAFQQERSEQGFFGRLIDGGAASRNAEVVARAKYQRELQQNNEVERARAMGAYNSNIAYDNSRRAAALTRAGSADKVNPSILEQVRGTANNLRTMSLYDSIFGVDDKHKTGADDLFRFGGNVIQGIGTAPTTGVKSLIETAAGRGTDYETGEEKDLNGGEMIGRAISGAVDIAGTFLGGSEKLVRSVAQKVARNTATEAEKTLLKRAVAQFVVPALIEGGENGVQAAADYFGEGGALRDENGEIDLSKVGEFLTQVGSGAALGTLAGGVFTGTAAGVNRVRNAPKMNEGGYIRMPGEDITGGLSKEQAEFINSYAEMLEDMGTGNGVSINPETNTRISNNVRDAETKGKRMSKYDWFEKARRDIESGRAIYGASDDYGRLPGITQDTPEASTQATQDVTPVSDVPEVDAPKDVTPAADGVSNAGVTPVARDVPVVPTEQVRALKEARVGKSQADEAVINQQIKEAEAATPSVKKGTDDGKAMDVDPLESLKTEARKYKSAEEFAEAQWKKRTEYKDGHRAPSNDGTPVETRLEESGDFSLAEVARGQHNVPDDFFDPQRGARYYSYDNPNGRESLKAIREVFDGKTDEVMVYRTVPKNIKADELADGDWVTMSKGYATQHGESRFGEGEYKIISQKTKAKDIFWDGNDINEWGYDTGKGWQDDIDLYNQATAPKTEGVGKAKVEPKPTPEAVTPIKSKKVPKVDTSGTHPTKGNLPDDMGGEAPKPKGKTKENYLQRTVSSDASTKDVRGRLTAISEVKDAENFDEIVDNIPKANDKIKQRLKNDYTIVEAAEKRINQIQRKFRKGLSETNTQNVSMKEAQALAHERNKLVQDMQIAEKNIQNTIKRLESRQSIKQRAINSLSNLVSYQQGNMLASLPVQEKNIVGDIVATVTSSIRHPAQMAKNVPEARLSSEFKKALREASEVLPQTVSEVPRYIIRTALSPVYAINNALANVRGGMYRTNFAKTELIKAGVKNPTKEQIRLQAMRAGNAREILVNLNKGVGAAISDPYKAAKAADEYFKVLENSTNHRELARFAQNTKASANILQEMMSGKGNNGRVTPMSLLINTIYPFTNPAINAVKKSIYQLDPRMASQVNQIRKVIQTPTRQNLSRLAKTAGSAASIYALAEMANEGILAYNDDNESGDVSKPRGWSIKIDENTYMPARAFGVFEPFIVGVGITHEVMNGNVKTPSEAATMAASSLPFMSSNEFYADAAKEISQGKLWDYGTQSQAVSRTKNLVPFVNNGLDRWMDRNSGNSTDAVSTYVSKKDASGKSVPDFVPWLKNSVRAGFGDTSGMKPSYTPSGQVRTADNQGAFINKRINDTKTKEFNSGISSLTKYGRENGLGKGQNDMFSTYDTGKNNNFKSTMDSITFLDVADGESPDNAKKLEKNEKLTDLSRQIREGFFGTTGMDLLTLDGKELYSDVSVPVKSGAKNSSLPINMQSIKNAIAATDLPKEQRDRMYELSQANQALYERRKNKEITYDQEQALKAQNEEEYVKILSGSKNYQRMQDLFNKLDKQGFFEADGLGSTKSGQTYLWNALNSLLGSKGKTPAANWKEDGKGFTPWGRGGGGGRSGSRAAIKFGDRNNKGLQWSPVKARQMAAVKTGKYTPAQFKVKLNNQVKKDKSQNYSDRTI